MKTAPVVHLYVLGDLKQPGLANLLAELGLEGIPLTIPVEVLEPALILIGPGHEAPPGYSNISFTPPADAPPSVLREPLPIARLSQKDYKVLEFSTYRKDGGSATCLSERCSGHILQPP